MVLTFRDEKGSPLTSAEGDENIRHLKGMVDDVLANPPEAISISNITDTDSTFTVWLTDGSSLGPFIKPVAVIKWRGEWLPSTGYFVNDLVWVDDLATLYFVTQNHVSDTEFDDTLENSGENIYQAVLGPLVTNTLGNLDDVNYDTVPGHGFILRYDASNEYWNSEHEQAIMLITANTLTLGPTHLGKVLRCNHVDGCTVTIPNHGGTDWDLNGVDGEQILYSASGRRVTLIQLGGPITVEGAASVHVLSPEGYLNNTNGVNHVIELLHTSDIGGSLDVDNVWHLYGMLELDTSGS